MVKYFVFSADASDWYIDADRFASLFVEHWPEARLEEAPDDDESALEFCLTIDGDFVSGRLDRDGASLVLAYDVLACAKLALWFRSLAPAEHTFVFCDSSVGECAPLDPSATAEEVAAPFVSA
jgi:hypothetical protein